MANLIELKIPDIGATDVNVAEVYVKVGDKINIDDNLIMLETDKATMEVPATSAGTVKEIKIKVGDKVNEGNLILILESTANVEVKSAPVAVSNSTPTASADVVSSHIELKIPDIGATDVNVAEVYVKVGDKINIDDNLIMLETDKATMEVPATSAGTIKEIKIKVGDKVNEGNLILILEGTSNVAVQPALATPSNVEVAVSKVTETTKTAESPKNAPVVNNNTTKIDEVSFSKAFASPSIRKLARELGVDLGRVKGNGTKGRITENDLKEFVKGVMTGSISAGIPTNGSGLDILPWPKVDFAKFGEIEVKAMSRIKQISGANLARNWVMIPHVTQFDEADITTLEEFRKQLNEEYKKAEIKITPLAFLIKACVFALKKFPEFNASIDGGNLVYKKYYNIGFAADTPNGLVVPVLKDADKKGIIELANESSALAKLARDGKLKPTDMQGGTFTISSLGGIGGTAFTPIVNAPEVAILGISKSGIKPIWNGNEFIPRQMLPLSLSYDHRIIDGALAAKFTSYLAGVIADIRRLSL